VIYWYCNVFHCEASDHPVVRDMQIVNARDQTSLFKHKVLNENFEIAEWYVAYSTKVQTPVR
jgi:hypothetical protein